MEIAAIATFRDISGDHRAGFGQISRPPSATVPRHVDFGPSHAGRRPILRHSRLRSLAAWNPSGLTSHP